MKQRHSVIPRTMCFVFYEDEVLLIKGSSEKEWAGFYDPLGGHIEQGEDILESAAREIKEESGLEVINTQLRGIIHVTNFFGKNIMMFVTTSTATTKEVTSGMEGELEWVKVSKIEELKVFEDVKPILEKVMNSPDAVFTGVSEFDGKSGLINLVIKS